MISVNLAKILGSELGTCTTLLAHMIFETLQGLTNYYQTGHYLQEPGLPGGFDRSDIENALQAVRDYRDYLDKLDEMRRQRREDWTCYE